MKWFFALNAESPSFALYADMAKVAVLTAAQHTSLEPHFIYDGPENDLTAWMHRHGVRVISCRTPLYDDLRRATATLDPGHLFIAAGAFLRLEVPRLMAEMGCSDEFALYTDCDVMFMRDVAPLDRLKPRYFAVSAEASTPATDPRQLRYLNSGVMLMNVERLRCEDRSFRTFVVRHLAHFMHDSYDQGAYKAYFVGRLTGWPSWDCKLFSPWLRLRKLTWNLCELLPPEFNWRPYWGDVGRAVILHFHGPKPQHRAAFHDGRCSHPGMESLLPFVTRDYVVSCDMWHAVLQRAA